jgi:hypothetical protein
VKSVLFCQNNTKLARKVLFLCEIDYLSGKDDQNGKKIKLTISI